MSVVIFKSKNEISAIGHLARWVLASGLWAGAAALAHAGTVPDFDLREMQARALNERQMRQPVVHWETVAGDFSACPAHTSAQDLYLPSQGCAVVDAGQNRCTIYTNSRTTHSIVGHLVRHCFEGRL